METKIAATKNELKIFENFGLDKVRSQRVGSFNYLLLGFGVNVIKHFSADWQSIICDKLAWLSFESNFCRV
jgi:hypothetical protein